jgi:hypothetical protein
MTRLLFALSILIGSSSTVLADDFYEGYVCEVRMQPLENYDATPDNAGMGRINFSVRPNSDCTGTLTVLWACSLDAPSTGDCVGSTRRFTCPEMQSIYGTLTNAVATGLRAAAYTPAGRASIQVLHIKQ